MLEFVIIAVEGGEISEFNCNDSRSHDHLYKDHMITVIGHMMYRSQTQHYMCRF